MRICAGFVLFWLVSGAIAQEAFPCSSLWLDGDVAEYLGVAPCVEYEVTDGQFLALAGQHRVFHTPGWLENDYRRELIQTVISAVAESVETLNDIAGRTGFGLITDTSTIVGVEDFIEAWGAAAAVAPVRDLTIGEVCPILVDGTAARRAQPAALKQIIAHEVFHCLEHSNGYFPSANDEWWAEGAAEYFSNVVYPTADHEYFVSGDYEPSIRPVDHLPVDDLSARKPYATVTFFQHLGNLAGPDWVLRRVFSLPQDSAPDAFHDELVSWPRIPVFFQSFAERFVDGEIFDSAVALAPGARTTEVLPVRTLPPIVTRIIYADEGVETITFEVAPLVFGERHLVFANGKEFEIEVSTNDQAGQFSVRRYGEGEGWADMPSQIRTNCAGNPLTYSLMATSTATEAESRRHPYTITLQIAGRDRDDCAFELLAAIPYNCHAESGGLQLDECLAGSWRMTEESLVQSLSGTRPSPDNEYSHLDHAGSILLAFDGSGTFVKEFKATIDHTKFDGTIMNKVIGHVTREYRGVVGGCVTSKRMPVGPNYLYVISELVDTVAVRTFGDRDRVHRVDRLDKGTPWNQWPRLGSGIGRYSCEGDRLTIGRNRVYQRVR